MSKLSLVKTMKVIQKAATKHSPEILTGIGIAGMIMTTVMAVKVTPKAVKLLDEEKNRKNDELLKEAKSNGQENCRQISKLEPLDVVKTSWKLYVPAVITGSVSIACLIGSNSVSARRSAVLATACSLSEAALSDYKEKVVETVGEKKEQLIRDKVAKSKIEKNPVSNKEVIITEKGDTLCYDAISGRYFKSDIEKIRKAENELNRSLTSDMYISLNEFYYELGLKPTRLGDDLGWNIDDGLIDVSFSSQLADDGTPCLVIDYCVAPRYDYKDFS